MTRSTLLLFAAAFLLVVAGVAWFSIGAGLIAAGVLAGVAAVAAIEVDDR